MTQILTSILLVLGGLFCLLGAVGILRMPDIFTRLQAATKTGTLGVGFVMLAVCVHFQDLGVSVRSMLVIAFLFLTAPIAGHVIARAAYFVSTPLWDKTALDELKAAIARDSKDAPAQASPPTRGDDDDEPQPMRDEPAA
jgi:multicomponent Na+:H+ antiporter subunit G